MILIIFSSIISISLVLFITIKPFRFASYINLIDKANQNDIKLHKLDTPKTGGIALFVISTQIFLTLFLLDLMNQEIISIYIITSSFFIIGIIDDYINFSAIGRLIGLTISCCLSFYLDEYLIIKTIYFDTIDQNITTNNFDFIFTIFCFLALQNAFNFADGSNGNLLTITLSILLILLLINPNLILASIIAVIIILFIGNINNLIFLGNNGSSIIASIVSIFLIIYNKEYSSTLSGELIVVLLMLPGIDMIRVTFIRIYNNRNPFIGDRNHFHHIVFDKIKKRYWIPSYFFLMIIFFILTSYIETYFILIFQIFTYYYLLKKFRNIN